MDDEGFPKANDKEKAAVLRQQLSAKVKEDHAKKKDVLATLEDIHNASDEVLSTNLIPSRRGPIGDAEAQMEILQASAAAIAELASLSKDKRVVEYSALLTELHSRMRAGLSAGTDPVAVMMDPVTVRIGLRIGALDLHIPTGKIGYEELPRYMVEDLAAEGDAEAQAWLDAYPEVPPPVEG